MVIPWGLRGILSALALTMTGCATTYHPPKPGEPAATLTARSDHRYRFSLFKNTQACTGRMEVGFIRDAADTKVRIPAGKVQTLMLVSGENSFPEVKQCISIVEFVPEADRQYLVTHLGPDESGCRVDIVEELVDQNGVATIKPVAAKIKPYRWNPLTDGAC